MLKRGYFVFIAVAVLAIAAGAQTAQPCKCPEAAAPSQPAIMQLKPLAQAIPAIPPPLIPEAFSSSFALAAPAALSTLPQQPQPESEAPLVFSFGGGTYLGVYLEEVTPQRVKDLGLKEERGAIVMKVVAGSPAEKAGLKENDVIVSFNGRPVDSVREFQRLMSETPQGRSVAIEVVRNGQRQTLTATIGKRSGFGEGALLGSLRAQQESRKQYEDALKRLPRSAPRAEGFGNFNFVFPEFALFGGRRLGIGVETLTTQLSEFFGAKGGGVLVTHVEENTAAARGGLKAGDVIVSVDNEKVTDTASLARFLGKKEEGAVTLQVIRDRKDKTITVNLEKRNYPRTSVRPARPTPPARVVSTPPRMRLI